MKHTVLGLTPMLFMSLAKIGISSYFCTQKMRERIPKDIFIDGKAFTSHLIP